MRLEAPEGTMRAESEFYLEREADRVALDLVHGQGGETFTIKGPRQMGKSSLLMRVIEEAEKEGKRVVFLDFQLFEQPILRKAGAFYREFCAQFGDELDLPNQTDQYWSKGRGDVTTCTDYVGSHLLTQSPEPVLLAIDEVENLIESDFRNDFFTMLRGWHNFRARRAVWRKLDMVFVTSTEPYQLIENLNVSPFNVGEPIELGDFDQSQVAELNRRHGQPFQPNTDLPLLYDLLNGHPYLTRRALYLVAKKQQSVATLLIQASEASGPFSDHLRHHLFRVQGDQSQMDGLHQVLKSRACPDEKLFYRLYAAGLVKRQGREVVFRCRLYQEYFARYL